jgi:hypothetical protein
MIVAAGLRLFLCVAPLVFFYKKLSGECISITSTITGIFGALFKNRLGFRVRVFHAAANRR